MKDLIKIIKENTPPLFPKIRRDNSKKTVEFCEEGWLGNNMTELYWAIKGYSVKRVIENQESDNYYKRTAEQEYKSGEGI